MTIGTDPISSRVAIVRSTLVAHQGIVVVGVQAMAGYIISIGAVIS
jgi:hypothetical protein